MKVKGIGLQYLKKVLLMLLAIQMSLPIMTPLLGEVAYANTNQSKKKKSPPPKNNKKRKNKGKKKQKEQQQKKQKDKRKAENDRERERERKRRHEQRDRQREKEKRKAHRKGERKQDRAREKRRSNRRGDRAGDRRHADRDRRDHRGGRQRKVSRERRHEHRRQIRQEWRQYRRRQARREGQRNVRNRQSWNRRYDKWRARDLRYRPMQPEYVFRWQLRIPYPSYYQDEWQMQDLYQTADALENHSQRLYVEAELVYRQSTGWNNEMLSALYDVVEAAQTYNNAVEYSGTDLQESLYELFNLQEQLQRAEVYVNTYRFDQELQNNFNWMQYYVDELLDQYRRY